MDCGREDHRSRMDGQSQVGMGKENNDRYSGGRLCACFLKERMGTKPTHYPGDDDSQPHL